MRFGSKKGQWSTQELLKAIGELLLVLVFVTLPIFFYASSFGTVHGYEKVFLAKDIALMIDAMYIGQGNITVVYPIQQNSSNYYFNFSKNQAQVSSEKTAFFLNYYPFSEDGVVKFKYTEVLPSPYPLILEKNSDIFTVTRQSELNYE